MASRCLPLEHIFFFCVLSVMCVASLLYLLAWDSGTQLAHVGAISDGALTLPSVELAIGPDVSVLLSHFWSLAEAWMQKRRTAYNSDIGQQRPRVLEAIARKIREITRDTFVGETVLLHAAALCAAAQDEQPTLLVYSGDNDFGQLAYMFGTWLPESTVLALHPTAAECAGHANKLAQMRTPGLLNLRSVIVAGLWSEPGLLQRLVGTPAVVDVQVIIGTKLGQQLLEPAVLQEVLALARWTLISLPVEVLGDGAGDTIHRALRNTSNKELRLDTDVSILGLVRVPATQEMQALFLVWVWHVERRISLHWHHGASPQPEDKLKLEFGVDQNVTMTTAGGPTEEVAGVTLESLLALGVPMSERANLMAAALADLRPGPASWVVCCGGIWQWIGDANGRVFPIGATGSLSYLFCIFMLAPGAVELIQLLCRGCNNCDQEPLVEGLTPESCVECGECIQFLVVPRLALTALSARQTLRSAASPQTHVEDFFGPLADDIPGIGDLGNLQVFDLGECAHLCRENLHCSAFEFSATVASILEPVRNCQLCSSRARAGVQFRDFVLYLRLGVLGSVDNRLAVNFELAGESGAVDSEAVMDRGTAFGAIAGNQGRYGWLCGSEERDHGVASPAGSTPLHTVTGSCAEPAWQIAVPPGIYKVSVQVVVEVPFGGVVECMAQGVPLQSLGEPPLPQTSPPHAVPEPGHLAITSRDGSIPSALVQATGTDIGVGASGTIGVLLLGGEAIVGDAELFRLARCHTQRSRLARIELRRTWRHCVVPVGLQASSS